MAIDLYFMPESPPCRAVQMVAAHLTIPLNLKYLNLAIGQHYTDQEFGKLNPQRVVPTIVDNGFVLWESRAIITYLVDKYAPGSSLYPNDPTLRAKVNQLLYFDIGLLYKTEGQYLTPILSSEPLDAAKEEPFKKALAQLDGVHLADGAEYVCGSTLTVADISLLASLSFAEAARYDLSGYPNLTRWLAHLKQTLPYYEQINGEAIQRFTAYLDEKKRAMAVKVNETGDANNA